MFPPRQLRLLKLYFRGARSRAEPAYAAHTHCGFRRDILWRGYRRPGVYQRKKTFNGHPDVAKAIDNFLMKDSRYKHVLACGHNRVFRKEL